MATKTKNEEKNTDNTTQSRKKEIGRDTLVL